MSPHQLPFSAGIWTTCLHSPNLQTEPVSILFGGQGQMPAFDKEFTKNHNLVLSVYQRVEGASKFQECVLTSLEALTKKRSITNSKYTSWMHSEPKLVYLYWPRIIRPLNASWIKKLPSQFICSQTFSSDLNYIDMQLPRPRRKSMT